MDLDKIHLSSSNVYLGGNSFNRSNKLLYLNIFIAHNSENFFDLNKRVGKFYAAFLSAISNCGLNKKLVTLEILKRKWAPIFFLTLIDVKLQGIYFVVEVYHKQVSK